MSNMVMGLGIMAVIAAVLGVLFFGASRTKASTSNGTGDPGGGPGWDAGHGDGGGDGGGD